MKHVNVFILGSNMENAESISQFYELIFASNGIRAHCFSEDDISIDGSDYLFRKSVISSAIASCDYVIFDGDSVSEEKFWQLEAITTNSVVCCVGEAQEKLKLLPNPVRIVQFKELIKAAQMQLEPVK